MKLRTKLAFSTAAIALMASSSAHADGMYLSLFGGISTFDDDVNFNATQSTSSVRSSQSFGLRTVKSGVLTFTARYGYSTYTVTATSPTTTGYSFYITTVSTSRNIGTFVVKGTAFGTSSTVLSSAFAWNDDFETGFVIGGAFGMDFGNNWRGELELAYRSNDVDSGARAMRSATGSFFKASSVPTATRYNYRYGVNTGTKGSPATKFTTFVYGWPYGSISGTTTKFYSATKNLGPYSVTKSATPVSSVTVVSAGSNGQAETWSIMANLWYDFDLGDSPIKPFIGGGIGAAHVNLEYNAAAGTYFGGTVAYRLDDGGWGFAYQVGAGVGYDLGGGMTLSAEYRYFGATDVDVGNTEVGVESHNFMVGLRIPLGQ